ncbi:MAG: Cof-type HAD-IIB family hydrolase [Treponema sp.]|jgi:Cof subfamily protein (haloacid dehalogenase superfamily)|nr:Cof-type HAD-IIB family hydrolase [Treponema sp.]
MHQKVIFLDIDGTLILGNQGPFQFDIQQIQKVHNFGHKVFINTGRSYSNIPLVFRNVSYIDGFILGSGSHVVINGKTVYHKLISQDVLNKICHYYLTNKNKWCVFEGEFYNYAINDFDKSMFVTGIVSIEESEFFSKEYPFITKLTFGGQLNDDDERKFLEDFFQLNSFSDYFEGIIKYENKANGMKIVLENLGISQENTLAIGDSMNDMEAIRFAKIGIAMKNACDELKQQSDDITDDYLHGGVGKALQKWVNTSC